MIRTLLLLTTLLLASASAAAGDKAAASDAGATKTAPHAAAAPAEQAKANPDARKDQRKVLAESAKDQRKPSADVSMSGISILGNEDAPKSLVIVPWKSSQLGDMPGMSMLLDDSARPVDKDVFMRELSYYRIRANAK